MINNWKKGNKFRMVFFELKHCKISCEKIRKYLFEVSSNVMALVLVSDMFGYLGTYQTECNSILMIVLILKTSKQSEIVSSRGFQDIEEEHFCEIIYSICKSNFLIYVHKRIKLESVSLILEETFFGLQLVLILLKA